MFDFVRRIMARPLNRPEPEAEPPQDPHTSVRQPRRGNPGGRSSAVAVAEPEPPGTVSAIGTSFPSDPVARPLRRLR